MGLSSCGYEYGNYTNNYLEHHLGYLEPTKSHDPPSIIRALQSLRVEI